MTLGEAAALVGGRVLGDPSVAITGVAGLREAGPGDLSFLSRAAYAPLLASTRASAVLAAAEVPCPVPLVLVKDPEASVTRIAAAFAPAPWRPPPGVHPAAFVDPEAVLGEGVSVGPRAVVEGGARLGARTVVRSGAVVARGAAVGEDCWIHPGAVVGEGVVLGSRVTVGSCAVVGGDGFGFLPAGPGKVPLRVPQVGTVEVGDDVDIGACASVARARFGRTVIARGAKIDALVQVAHNCRVGEGSILAAQTGLAGSTVIGRDVLMGGQVGAGGHVEVGDGARVAAQSGVTKDVPPGATVAGTPAEPHALWRRHVAQVRKIAEILERLKRLEGGGGDVRD
jgi:UDP-3-O-[3-hydroxymyristoyl] glucosamine N-acyltransferase